MNKFYGLTAAVLFSLFFLSGCALLEEEENPDPNQVSSNVKSEWLAEKMKKASDPEGIYAKCTSFIIKQKLTVEGDYKERTIEVKFKAPSFMKTVTIQKGKSYQATIYNGTKAWQIYDETSTEITGNSFEFMQLFTELGNPSKTLFDIFAQIEVFETKENNKEYYKLVCIPKNENLKPCKILVDKNNFLTYKIETQVYTANGLYPYASVIDKYEKLNGIMVGAKTTVLINGKKSNYDLLKYELNPEIPDSEFTLPTPWYTKEEHKVSEPEKKPEQK